MLKAKYYPTDTIKPLKDNPRSITEEALKTLCKSVQDNPEYFEARPIILSDRTGDLVIIAGNQRLKVAISLKLKKVPAILIPNLTEAKEKEIIIRDNVNNGDWDWDMLSSDNWDEELLKDYGVNTDLFDTLHVDAEDDILGNNKEPDNLQVDIVEGDIIQFICTDGRVHRLLCGDSMCTKNLKTLMGEKKPFLVLSDPPYHYDEVVSKKMYGFKKNKMGLQLRKNATKKMAQIAGIYKFDIEKFFAFIDSSYLKEHTMFFFCNKVLINNYLHYGVSNKLYYDVLVWCKKGGIPFMSKGLKPNMEYIIKLYPKGHYLKTGLKNVNYGKWWDCRREGVKKGSPYYKGEGSTIDHPTVKPYPILKDIILIHSKRLSIVLDLFLGSGSTMVAAHKLSRVCYGIELEPKYCQLILNRMLKLDSSLQVKINGKIYSKVIA